MELGTWVKVGCALLGGLVLGAWPAQADEVRLGELLPELRGTAVGDVTLGEAPAAGEQRWLSRRKVLQAVRKAGLSVDGLVLPPRLRVSRKARVLAKEEVNGLVQGPIEAAMAPCEVTEVRAQTPLRVGEGPVQAEVPSRAGLRDGRMSVIVLVRSSFATARVPVMIQLNCPPPAVHSGDRVRLETHVASVRATAPGKALQTGRVGEFVQVENVATGTRLRGQVAGPQRVVVMP